MIAHSFDIKPGSVIMDVAGDQGGCVEGTQPTIHDDPVFIRHGVIYYCVANMPGGVARTSTFALNNATLPYVLKIADTGVTPKLIEDASLAKGVNLYRGNICYSAVAECHRSDCTPIEKLLE